MVVSVLALAAVAGLAAVAFLAIDEDDEAPPAPLAAVAPVAPPSQPSLPRCLVAPPMAVTRRVTSGGPLALSPGEAMAAVADGDNDAVVLLALDAAGARLAGRLATARGPAQVVVATDGRVFVTERRANSVAVFAPGDGRLLCRAAVAADPVGIALAPDEQTVYVTSGLTHTLTALDAATFATRYTADVPREPRGLAISPDGARAFLAHLAGAPLSAVDLTLAGARARALPAVPIATEINAGSVGTSFERAWIPIPPVTPLPSQAYGVALDPEARRLWVPFMVSRTGREVPREIRVDAYGAGSVNIQRESEKVSFALGAFDIDRGEWESVDLPLNSALEDARGGVRIPSAVALRPSDRALLVASTGTSAIATVTPLVTASIGRRGGIGITIPLGRRGPTAAHTAALAPTLTAPTGVAVTSRGVELVYSQIEHAVEVRTPAGRARVPIGPDPLPADLALGRRLFHTANDPRISSGGLSCAGCHPEGRDDGLTWFLSQGPRQTPTLARYLSPPFNWNGTHRTLEGNIAQTVRRLGGTGLTMAEIDALAAFLQRGLLVPVREPQALSALAARGRALFAGEAACTICHDPGRHFTDGLAHELGGLGADESERLFDTPSLEHVGATAPYFHDGRYPTLRALLTDPGHRMGHVERLTPLDVDALVAYLETL